MKIVTRSAEQTIALGEKLGALLGGGEIIAYTGDLGAGKTTMTRGISIGMGLGDEVTSPTFALVNEYHGAGKSLYHFDMYRITSSEDLETTGFYDYMDGDSVIAAEWSENIAEALETLGQDILQIDIKRVDDDTRRRMDALLSSGWADDDAVAAEIKRTWNEHITSWTRTPR